MCGIAGIYSAGGEIDRELVRAMVARLHHRGPDGQGEHSDGHVALGMRRLAIIDPEHGQQPLFNEAGDVVAIFNGEIYNHKELREELLGKGHRMHSHSDGEVIPHLYEEHGADFVERLNGIFAIALWDAGKQTLHLARDKFGVKPLYWSEANGRLTFASELKALLVDPALSRELDLTAIDQFLTFRFVPAPRTPFAAVRKLPPASALTVDARGAVERRWWTGVPQPTRSDTDNLVHEYADAFERAVVRQMMSDRPIGVMLSGGVDSAAIAAVVAKHSPQMRTFTVGFSGGGEGTNEIPLAAETARLFGAEHESVLVGPGDYLERFPDSLLTLEEPVGSTSALAVRFVAELMKPSVPVALTGQGADEPLGGYGRHLGVKVAAGLRTVAPLTRPLARLAERTSHPQLRRGLATLDAKGDAELLLSAYSIFREPDKRRLYGERMRGLIGDPELAGGRRAPSPPRGQAAAARADALRGHAPDAAGRAAADRRQDVDGRVGGAARAVPRPGPGGARRVDGAVAEGARAHRQVDPQAGDGAPPARADRAPPQARLGHAARPLAAGRAAAAARGGAARRGRALPRAVPGERAAPPHVDSTSAASSTSPSRSSAC